MPFIGNQPALSYTSFAKQDFTTSATTAYALSQPVTNENEIALFINFVRQEPTTAYTASGTSLTLTSATSASDDMYAIFLGKAVQTVNPPAGSVGTSQLADASVTSAKLGSNAIDTQALSLFNASGSAPVYACRAWVKFNGTGTVAINNDGNVSSITDNGTGTYTINFTTAMPSSTYSVTGCAQGNGFTGANFQLNDSIVSQSTTQVGVRTFTYTNSPIDVDEITAMIIN